MSAILPDAAPANWVDRHAPAGLRPWLKLARFDRPAGIWLLMLPGWQGIALAAAMVGHTPNLWLLGLFFLGATLMRSAGCAYNDIVDRDIDAKVARTARRPIPAGQISVRAAWAFVIGCSLASLLILLSLNLLSVGLGIGSLALVAIYPFMKRVTWWPQAWLGLTFNWGALMGFAAASGGLPLLDWARLELATGGKLMASPGVVGFLALPAWLLYASGVFWTLGYDTIYAVQDLEDDALAGVKSSARRLGAAAPRAVFGFYAIALLLAAGAGRTAMLGWPFWPLLGAYALALLIQPRRLKLDEPRRALALFQLNARAGLLLFLALTVGYWQAGA
jgi:4-hydroxybenzoate polyprenyltransferase